MTSKAIQPGKRILIAEADPVVRRLLTFLVNKEGYDAVVVDDGRKAYRILQSDADFSAGIFDTVMPYLEGLEILRYMMTENRLRRIPVLMTSAEPDLEVMAKSFAAGATFFLTKPFNRDRLQSTLRLFLNNHGPQRSGGQLPEQSAGCLSSR